MKAIIQLIVVMRPPATAWKGKPIDHFPKFEYKNAFSCRFALVAFRTFCLKMHSNASLSFLIVNFVVVAFASEGPLSMWEFNEIMRKILGSIQISP